MKLFCVLDVKAAHYLNPFSDQTTIQALRAFESVANEPGTTFNKFPDDFCLMELGEFDRLTGKIRLNEAPMNLATARSVLRQPWQPTSVEASQ